MLIQLKKPSKSLISSQFCLEKLLSSAFINDVNIFFTGRTGSGKTTLINLLAGGNYFDSTGFQDCTDEVNFLELKIGLKSFDLPGVCSDDRLENYNRAALGIKQLADLAPVDNLTIAKYSIYNGLLKRHHCKAIEFCRRLKLDLIFYLLAPDKQFLSDDRKYLTNLLRHYHQVIYVLNMFADEQGEQNFFATPQNIADATKKITKIHKSILGENKKPKILQVNCRTGEGIDELFMESHKILGSNKGKIFQVLIDYQSTKTPDAYATQIKQEILKLCAYAACQKVTQNNDSQSLSEACKQLWEFLTDILDEPQQMPKPVEKAVKKLVNQINNECIEKHYEDEFKKVSKPIYKLVPDIQTVSDEVDDYSRPIYKTRTSYCEPGFFEGISNLFRYDRWKTEYTYTEIVGYKKKTVTKQEYNGVKNEYSGTEEVIEKTGKKILKGETYHYFKEKAIILILVFSHLVASREIFQYEEKREVIAQYSILSEKIKNRMDQLLPSFSDVPTEQQVLNWLQAHINQFF